MQYMAGRADLWGYNYTGVSSLGHVAPGSAGDWANGVRSFRANVAVMSTTFAQGFYASLDRYQRFALAKSITTITEEATITRVRHTRFKRRGHAKAKWVKKVKKQHRKYGRAWELMGEYDLWGDGNFFIGQMGSNEPCPACAEIKRFFTWFLNSLGIVESPAKKPLRLVVGTQFVILGDADVGKILEDFGGKFDPNKNTITLELSELKELFATFGIEVPRKITNLNEFIWAIDRTIKTRKKMDEFARPETEWIDGTNYLIKNQWCPGKFC